MKEQAVLAGVEGARVAVDAVFDSVSVATTYKDELAKAGVIFCSISDAVREHPDLVRKYLGSVVPVTDNFFATLEFRRVHGRLLRLCAERRALPDGAVDLFPHQRAEYRPVRATLIIADAGSYVSYLEGCTAPKRDENQLHAAVVELVALDDAEIKYSTVQNWYPGDEDGKGGIYNFVTKRGDCRGKNVEDLLDAGRDRLGDHLEISVLHPAWRRLARRVLFDRGVERLSAGRFRHEDAASRQEHREPHHLEGHRGRAIRRTLIAGLVSAHRKAIGARNFTNCDSSLIGQECGAHTVPYIESKNASAVFEHEATTSKIAEDQLFYCLQRGLNARRRWR